MSTIQNSRYLDPTNDVAFKKLFFQKDLIIHFINTVLKLEGETQIVDLDYLPQEQVPVVGELKRSIVDVKVKDAKNRHYIVEMQNAYIEEFIKRTEYYGASAIVNQVETGEKYTEVEPVIVICITKNHLVLKDSDLDVISYHQVSEKKTGRCYFKNLSYVLIELERFNKKQNEFSSIQDHWLHYFKNVQEFSDIPQNLEVAEIKKAYATIERFNWTRAELDQYIKTELYIQSQSVTMDARFTEGKAEGERLKQIEIAKKMLEEKLSLEIISKCSDLSIEEINRLL